MLREVTYREAGRTTEVHTAVVQSSKVESFAEKRFPGPHVTAVAVKVFVIANHKDLVLETSSQNKATSGSNRGS